MLVPCLPHPFIHCIPVPPQATIEGRRDVRGGRLAADRRAAGNMSSGAAFTSLAYSADGSWLLAAGASKYVCIYDVVEKVMLRRFQVCMRVCVISIYMLTLSLIVYDGVCVWWVIVRVEVECWCMHVS